MTRDILILGIKKKLIKYFCDVEINSIDFSNMNDVDLLRLRFDTIYFDKYFN